MPELTTHANRIAGIIEMISEARSKGLTQSAETYRLRLVNATRNANADYGEQAVKEAVRNAQREGSDRA